ncbi:MAG: site-specific integrase [Alphaproteobacteria bacterium]|nr:site-specific integrase [Alphaproteobacteria bacterium]
MIKHSILGNKVHVYKRDNSRYWQCSTYLQGKNRRTSTKEDSLQHAKQFAEDWYLELRGKSHAGILKDEKTFKHFAEQFLKEYEVITEGQRSPKWVEGHAIRLRVHLNPFFGNLSISDVTAGKVQEYRVHRMTPQLDSNPAESKSNRSPTGKPPARKTIHNEIVTLRQVLKTAIRHGDLSSLPELSPPYKTQGKVVHRPWFSPAEYKQLYKATREYTKNCLEKDKWGAKQVHDFVLFMANTGLRPDEAFNLQHRDIEIVADDDTGEKILIIEVRGKRGIGYCKSTANAVRPYERLLKRPKPVKKKGADAEPLKSVLPGPIDVVFPGNHIKLFNGILRRSDLKLDRDNNARTSYSLRHTYICMRLMEGADIYQIAKNCRTSVEMIEKYYAAHIKTTLDASAINVRKSRPFPSQEHPVEKVASKKN